MGIRIWVRGSEGSTTTVDHDEGKSFGLSERGDLEVQDETGYAVALYAPGVWEYAVRYDEGAATDAEA